MDKTLQKLENWIVIIQKSILVLSGVEILIVLIIGVASNNVTNNTNSQIWTWILISLGILYIVLTVIKIAYNKSFPLSIVEELSSKKNLETALSQINRKDAINNYISNTIISLSKCKCKVPSQTAGSDWKKDADNDFCDGLKDVLNTFNNVLNILLNTTNFKFTTGVYVNHFRAISNNNHPISHSGLFLVRDDYELNKSEIIRDLMTNEGLTGIELEIQNAIKVSLHNGKHKTKNIKVNPKRKILLICSNIKCLKTDEQKGVLFILTEPMKELPEDVESVLRVFSNILSHWLDLYSHEVVSRQMEFLMTNLDKIEEEGAKDDGTNDAEYEEIK